MRTYEKPMIECDNCGKRLTAEFGEMPRIPCPNCESTRRNFTTLAGGGKLTITGGNVSLVHTRPGLNSTAQADDQGRVSLIMSGPSPKNEEDALDICARLVRALNLYGGNWSVPIAGDKDVDGRSVGPAADVLEMQVIRASHKRKFWQELALTGTARTEQIASEIAGDMIDAIKKKSIKYPVAQKKKLILILDAARTPIYTFQRVLDEFKISHVLECQNAGFLEVWIVGPQDSIVERIDQ